MRRAEAGDWPASTRPSTTGAWRSTWRTWPPEGWRLERIGPYFWTYRRAEPARVTYAVTYLPGVSQFDPDPSERQASLEELCAAAGWEKVSDWGQMQIFVSERAGPGAPGDRRGRPAGGHPPVHEKELPALGPGRNAGAGAGDGGAPDQDPRHGPHPPALHHRRADFTAVLWDALVVLQAAHLLLSYRRWCRRSAASVARGGPCAAVGPGLRRLNRARPLAGADPGWWGSALVLYLAILRGVAMDRRRAPLPALLSGAGPPAC